MVVRTMSDREFSRLEVMRDLQEGRLTTAVAAQLLDLKRRQVFRLLKAYRAEGVSGLISSSVAAAATVGHPRRSVRRRW